MHTINVSASPRFVTPQASGDAAAESTPGAAPSDLPAPTVDGVAISATPLSAAEQVAVMVLEFAKSAKEGADAERKAAEQSIQANQRDQVRQLRRQAKLEHSAATQKAVGQIVGGATSVASGAVTLGASIDAAAHTKAAAGMEGQAAALESAKAQEALTHGQGVAKLTDAGGALTTGALGLSAAEAERRAGHAGADATRSGHRTSAAERRLAEARDASGEAKALRDAARDFARSASQTSHESAMAVLRGMRA